MHVDVIVLAGGRSSRLDGVAKASLVVGGATLLQRAVVAGLGALAVGADAAPGSRGRFRADAAPGEGGWFGADAAPGTGGRHGMDAAPGEGGRPGADAATGGGGRLGMDAVLGEGGRLVVVGPDDETTALGDILRDPRLAGGMLLRARETPPFGGPAAAIAAGLAALGGAPTPGPEPEPAPEAVPGAALAPFVAVIACDHPRVEHALPLVLAALRDRAEESIDAWMAQGEDPPPLALVAQNARITHDESTLRDQHQGRLQPLLAVYRRASLDRRVNALRRERPGGLDGASVRQLIDGLALLPVRVPTADTADIDTWADAARFGAQPPTASAAARFAAQPTTASDAVLHRPTTIGGSS